MQPSRWDRQQRILIQSKPLTLPLPSTNWPPSGSSSNTPLQKVSQQRMSPICCLTPKSMTRLISRRRALSLCLHTHPKSSRRSAGRSWPPISPSWPCPSLSSRTPFSSRETRATENNFFQWCLPLEGLPNKSKLNLVWASSHKWNRHCWH